VARNVVERLIDLATETAVTMDAVTLRARLDDLFVRYRDLYRPAPRRAAFLRAQIDAIGAAGVLPAVFQHGDPGTWNILADIDRSVRFLDWEAADAHGVPLWDLFYFLRSFGVTVSRARGVEDALAAFRRQFLEETDLSRIQTEAIRRAREAIDLPVALVEPLFHTCWMHRAVKQASRLPRWKLGWGHYHRLVSTTIDERTAPGLRPMFAGG
jgi:thiamine kinase-like enzyme